MVGVVPSIIPRSLMVNDPPGSRRALSRSNTEGLKQTYIVNLRNFILHLVYLENLILINRSIVAFFVLISCLVSLCTLALENLKLKSIFQDHLFNFSM